jgi:PPM family protein phosphatase
VESRLFVRADMADAALLEFPGGQAAVYSVPAPDKPGPNEDGAALIAVDAQRGVVLVADGMGGLPAGDSAAATVVRSLARSLGRARGEDGSLRSAILDGLDAANRAVLDLGLGAAATLAAVAIEGRHVRVYHVGDTAALVVGQRGRLKLQTVSHSPVGYAVEAGVLDEKEALHHEERHLVSNMVGAPDMRIEMGSPLELAPRDTLLVASDGLFDNLGVGEIVALVRKGPLERCAAALARAGRRRMLEPSPGHPSKPDDLTFVLFRAAAGRVAPRRAGGAGRARA